MTGGKDYSEGKIASLKVIEEIKKIENAIEKENINKMKLIESKIAMINTTYHSNMLINRDSLFYIIKELYIPDEIKVNIIDTTEDKKSKKSKTNIDHKLKNIVLNVVFEPCIHAAVNVTYITSDGRQVHIFYFQTGKIIMTGAIKKEHVEETYKFANSILYNHYDDILYIDSNM
jgi:hypothetical protein